MTVSHYDFRNTKGSVCVPQADNAVALGGGWRHYFVRIIRAEYMIDDNIYHLRRFEGEKILFDSQHNRKVPHAVHRVRNCDEVLSFFRAQGVLPSS